MRLVASLTNTRLCKPRSQVHSAHLFSPNPTGIAGGAKCTISWTTTSAATTLVVNGAQLNQTNLACVRRPSLSMHCTPHLHGVKHLHCTSMFTSMFMRTCCLHVLMLAHSKDIFRQPQQYRPRPPPKPKWAKTNHGRKARENAQRA